MNTIINQANSHLPFDTALPQAPMYSHETPNTREVIIMPADQHSLKSDQSHPSGINRYDHAHETAFSCSRRTEALITSSKVPDHTVCPTLKRN